MERFYKIRKGSEFYKEYFDYLENTVNVNEVVKEFMATNNIDTSEYYPCTNVLYIVPTAKDVEKFDMVLSKEIGNNLRPFKKTSKINKAWVELLKSKNLKVLEKPNLCFIFNVCGKYSTRLFHIEDELYCSMKTHYAFESPEIEGFIEIKASEFFKIIEDEESKRAAKSMS